MMAISGCNQLPFVGQQYRLWFVHIHNGSIQDQNIEVRVLRDTELVFQNHFENIPHFKDTNTNESKPYGTKENSRIIKNEWDEALGNYTLEYRLSEQNPYKQVTLADLVDFEGEDVAIEIHILGGPDRFSTSLGVLKFSSKNQAMMVVDNLDSDNGSNR